ncbi:MAG: insulinase family protein [Candidatus Omnitrophica bacterium]|nr:insulinase family protein [Candidatus Omnitrophota bacterium]
MAYELQQLKNGLTVVLAPMPQASSASIGIWAKVGGRYEPARLSGVSHFLEHLLFKGTATRSCQEIKTAIEGVGGSMNGFTSEEFTCYLAKVLERHVLTTLEVLSDMVLEPRMAPVDIEKERQVILEEIRMYLDQPAHHVHDLFDEVLWPRQPLGASLAGTPETMRRMRRAEVVRHQRTYYHAQNLVIAVAGAFDRDAVLARIRRLFKQPAGRRAPGFARARGRSHPGVRLEVKQTEQAHLCLGTYAFPRGHRDRYALDLLHVVLGANMSSRLFQEVREHRGLAYEIGTHVKRFHDTGAFIVNAGCDPAKIVKTVEVILRELRRITASSVGSTELTRAKDYYTGQFLMALDDTMEHMLWIGEQVAAQGRTLSADEVCGAVGRITAGDVRRAARAVMRPRRLHLAAIAPLTTIQQRQLRRLIGSV